MKDNRVNITEISIWSNGNKITRFDTRVSAVKQEVTKSDTNDNRDKNVGGTVSEETENKTESVEAADNFTLF